jgi:anaerobic ribonucleoside-triphosphate reductase activating protein
MYYGNIKEFSVENGTGVRVSFFVSGCRHGCKNCFSEKTWSFEYGQVYDRAAEDKIMDALRPDYMEGLTILGGDPLEPENQPEVLGLIKRVRKELPEKNIWLFTGFVFEELITDITVNQKIGISKEVDVHNTVNFYEPLIKDEKSRANTEYVREILENIDVLIDGEFIEPLKNLNLKFRGSSNQRVIDVKSSLLKNQAVTIDEFMN